MEGKKQTSVYLDIGTWERWKRTGMRASFVFEKGLDIAGFVERERFYQTEIEKIVKTNKFLESEIQRLNDRIVELNKETPKNG